MLLGAISSRQAHILFEGGDIMYDSGRLLTKLSRAADLEDEPIPGSPLVEILGHQRVLIEHHKGVNEYGDTLIRVKVKFGNVCINGTSLELTHMSQSRLIIRGNIESIHLCRG